MRGRPRFFFLAMGQQGCAWGIGVLSARGAEGVAGGVPYLSRAASMGRGGDRRGTGGLHGAPLAGCTAGGTGPRRRECVARPSQGCQWRPWRRLWEGGGSRRSAAGRPLEGCCQPRAVPALRWVGQEQGHRSCVQLTRRRQLAIGLANEQCGPPRRLARGWGGGWGRDRANARAGPPNAGWATGSGSIQRLAPSGGPTGGPTNLTVGPVGAPSLSARPPPLPRRFPPAHPLFCDSHLRGVPCGGPMQAQRGEPRADKPKPPIGPAPHPQRAAVGWPPLRRRACGPTGRFAVGRSGPAARDAGGGGFPRVAAPPLGGLPPHSLGRLPRCVEIRTIAIWAQRRAGRPITACVWSSCAAQGRWVVARCNLAPSLVVAQCRCLRWSSGTPYVWSFTT